MKRIPDSDEIKSENGSGTPGTPGTPGTAGRRNLSGMGKARGKATGGGGGFGGARVYARCVGDSG